MVLSSHRLNNASSYLDACPVRICVYVPMPELCEPARCRSLAGIGLIRLHNTNAMIGELVVGARQFDLGHMARDAVVFRHLTGFGLDLPAAMAGLALCVIVSRLYAEFLVRIVAGNATDARVVGIVAFTAP